MNVYIMFPRVVPTPITKSPIHVPLTHTTVPICKDCKHFIPPKNVNDIKNGFCGKVGYINVLDGSIVYENLELARQYHCKGEMFEK